MNTVATLWIGDRLSWLEQLCLASFVRCGHSIIVYSYEPIPNLPQGVMAGNADEIMSGKRILYHKLKGSPAIHADLWRLNLIAKTDHIWVDADVLCHRKFDFDNDFVFGWNDHTTVCNAILGLPKGSYALAELLAFFEDEYAIPPWFPPRKKRLLERMKNNGKPMHITEQRWGVTGPAALTHFLMQTNEISHAKSIDVFYPVRFQDRNHMIVPSHRLKNAITDQTRAVHLWGHRIKNRIRAEGNKGPRPGSFLDRALKEHGIDPSEAPINN